MATGAVRDVRETRAEGRAFTRRDEVDVAPPGHTLRITWNPVAGATKAVVDNASVSIAAAYAEQTFTDLLKTACSNATGCQLTLPAGWRLRSATLQGLELVSGKVKLNTLPGGLRVVVSVPPAPGQPPMPLYAVPPVGARAMLPPSLTGASYGAPAATADGVLTLPDLPGPTIGLAVAQGDFPENFAPQPINLTAVNALAVIAPRNLQLLDPQGGAVWSFPGELPPLAPAADVDLRLALEKVFNAALKAKQGLDVTFTLKGDAPSRATVRFAGARGALLRVQDGVTRVALSGDPLPLPLGDALAEEAPQSAVADLTVSYAGIRIAPELSGTPPGPHEAVAGLIVAGQAVSRALPPEALRGVAVARIGLVGRAPEACELSVQLVEMSGGVPGAAIAPPGVLKLTASGTVGTAWVELPQGTIPDRPVGLAVRANQGRFFWAARAQPLIRVAVYDPAPGNRPLTLGGTQVLAINQSDIHLPAQALPAGVFRHAMPVWESELFLRVDLSDLVLRYAR